MAEDAKIIIDVDVETKKVDKELDRVLNEYTNKKIELDLQLRSQADIKKQLVELQTLMDKLKTPTPEMYEQFDKLSNSLKNSVSNIFILREQLNSLAKEYRTLNGELQRLSTTSPLNNIKNSFSNFGKILNQLSSSVSSIFGRITSSFKNFNFHAINSSRHVDYFNRRIFNLLRNAFVFNVISRQFRGLSALLVSLVHRDAIFAKSLMIVKANLVRAFAPIWQIILPWIRALGDGLVWISNQLIRFINFLTGFKIKPLQGFQEAKQVIDDFKRISSPTKDLFNLKDPNKYAKQLKESIKSSQQPSNKVSKNVDRLSRKLKDSQKQTTKLLASFDKLEVLKFKKIKDPIGLSELSDPKNLNNNKGIDIPINIPSIEDQISDAINNIQDKPLDFYVNDNLGEQITSQVNGLTLPALNFKVSEDSTNVLNNFKKKMMDFLNWISPLVESIKNLFKGLSESFKRLFDDLNENGTFKMVLGWFTEWKDSLTNFFNTISQNKEQMDTLRNFIIGIGVAFVTYSIVSKVFKLVKGFATLASILTGSPIGWISLIGGALAIAIINLDKFKNKFPNLSKAFEDLFTGVSKKITELSWQINNDLKESIKWLEEKAEGILHWLEKHPGALKTIQWIVERIVDQFGIAYNITKGLLKSIGQFIDKIGGIFNGTRSFADLLAPWGGKEYSRTLPNLPNLPHLAQGTVLKGGDPFLAYLNDQPRGQTNIEAPLSTIVNAFKQALSESNYNNQPNISINASGDMSSFIRMLNFRLQDENNRLGGSFVDTSSF